MTNTHANFSSERQQRGIRRTAWIVGGIAFAMFALFIVKQSIWH